jgi:small subunit ribosomal protein S16
VVKIRLRRTGAKKKPSYRIVVADVRAPRDGRFIETLGHYHPMEGSSFKVEEERVLYWLRRGAQPTQKVKDLLKRAKIWNRFIAS